MGGGKTPLLTGISWQSYINKGFAPIWGRNLFALSLSNILKNKTSNIRVFTPSGETLWRQDIREYKGDNLNVITANTLPLQGTRICKRLLRVEWEYATLSRVEGSANGVHRREVSRLRLRSA